MILTRNFALSLSSFLSIAFASGERRADYNATCSKIAGRISSIDAIHFPGSPLFVNLTQHWVDSSSQVPTCVVEPGTATDVGQILDIIGRMRTPFAVQSGGHTLNPRFSSTTGIHISLNRFRSIKYNPLDATVEFGMGLRWGDIYEALEPHAVSVVGARAAEVGVGGFTLGGGYSWKTNQHGLSLDTVTEFELVKPDGNVVQVSETSHPGLFFALKGSQNNFGIVTRITLRTFAQGKTWGGVITYAAPTSLSAVSAAIVRFSREVTDPKASMVGGPMYIGNTSLVNAFLFYDGPTPPAGIFDDFLNIPSISSTIRTEDSLSEFLRNVGPPPGLVGARARQIMVPVPEYSASFLNLANELIFAIGKDLTPSSLISAVFVAEPFLPDILAHTQLPSAYPFDRSKVFTPCPILFVWEDPAQDETFETAIKETRDTLEAALLAEGYDDIENAPLYPNYAIWDTPLDRLYGNNLPRLRELKNEVDPGNLMGLAGGFEV